ncbi:MAG: M23 family metallopeptidase, partial [Candidatus Binatia bacterium]
VTATAMPTPTATTTPTPLPPAVSVAVEPESPAQGQTVVVRVTLDRAGRVSGAFDGQPLTFLYGSATEAWALVGVPPWNATGERLLLLEVVAPDGQRARVTRALPVRATNFALQNIDMPVEQAFFLSAGLRPAEDAYLAPILNQVSPEPLWDGPFGIPADGVRTSPYGARRSYQGGSTASYHGGIDFAAPEGTPVLAPANGIVVLAEPLYVRGNLVILDHGAGVHTLYYHLSQVDVAEGQTVFRGDLLGLMGSTGLSTGSHLHWEVRIGEVYVAPDEWLARDFRP